MSKTQRILSIVLLTLALTLALWVFTTSAEELSPPYIVAMPTWDRTPKLAVVDEQRGYAYIGGQSGVAVFSGLTQTTVLNIGAPARMAVDPVRGYVYLSSTGDYVKVISPTHVSGQFIVQNVNVGAPSVAVAVMPTTGYAYVALPDDIEQGDDEVVILGTDAPSPPHIPVGDLPRDIDVNPNTGYVYVVNYGSNSITAFKSTGSDYTTIPVGDAPTQVTVNPDTGYVYVSNSDDTVSIIQNTTIQATLPISAPGDVAVNPQVDKVYILANDYSDFDNPKGWVEIIDGTARLGITITLPTDAREIAVNPNSGYGYVLGGALDTATVTIISNTTALETFPLGDTSQAMAVDAYADLAYVPMFDGRIAIFSRTPVFASPPLSPTGSSALTMECPNINPQETLPMTITIPAGAMVTPNTRLLCIPVHTTKDSDAYIWAKQAFRLVASIEPTGTRPANYSFQTSLIITATYTTNFPAHVKEQQLALLRHGWLEPEHRLGWRNTGIVQLAQSLPHNYLKVTMDNVGDYAVLWQMRTYLPLITRN